MRAAVALRCGEHKKREARVSLSRKRWSQETKRSRRFLFPRLLDSSDWCALVATIGSHSLVTHARVPPYVSKGRNILSEHMIRWGLVPVLAVQGAPLRWCRIGSDRRTHRIRKRSVDRDPFLQCDHNPFIRRDAYNSLS
jgi:hypothetical protein